MVQNLKHTHKKEAGVVLIITLWVILVLSASALGFLRQTQLEAKMVGFQRDAVVADTIARAGLRRALVNLREDAIKDHGEDFRESFMNFFEDDNYVYDGGSEQWADDPDNYIDVPFYEKGGDVGYFYVDVEDEYAKFPINHNGTTLDMIAHLLQLTGVEEDQATSLAAIIIDWRDADNVITDTGQSSFGRDGADEISFYNPGRSSRDQSIPDVIIKNAPFDSVDELLLIPGMTPQIVYGNVERDENERSGRFRSRRMRKGEYLGLRDYVSVYNSKININTVKPEVLEAILYPIMGDSAESLAKDWDDYRNGRDGVLYTKDDNVIKTLNNDDMDDMHFTEVNGFTEQVIGQLAPFMQVHSNTFVVTSLADFKGIEKGYRVVVNRDYIPWQNVPQFGFDTRKLEDLEQVRMQIRLFEPLFDAKRRIEKLI